MRTAIIITGSIIIGLLIGYKFWKYVFNKQLEKVRTEIRQTKIDLIKEIKNHFKGPGGPGSLGFS